MSVFSANAVLELGAQLRNALGHRVGIMALVNGGMSGGLDRLGHVEVRLADAQVDGVLDTPGQFEDFADARRLNVVHPGGYPAIVHGNRSRLLSMNYRSNPRSSSSPVSRVGDRGC